VFLLGPVAALLAFMPSVIGGWSFVFAILFLRWALKAAVLEADRDRGHDAGLLQGDFKLAEDANPEWEWRD
jgi:hypothetical protein